MAALGRIGLILQKNISDGTCWPKVGMRTRSRLDWEWSCSYNFSLSVPDFIILNYNLHHSNANEFSKALCGFHVILFGQEMLSVSLI